jgi:hypothetical protein
MVFLVSHWNGSSAHAGQLEELCLETLNYRRSKGGVRLGGTFGQVRYVMMIFQQPICELFLKKLFG